MLPVKFSVLENSNSPRLCQFRLIIVTSGAETNSFRGITVVGKIGVRKQRDLN